MQYDKLQLKRLLSHQTETFYARPIDISDYLDEVIDAVDVALSASKNKYNHAERFFSPFNTCQYSIFLYILSKKYSQNGDIENADILYSLNKALHSIDLYHGIELPSIWGVEHPLGSVMGRAKYGDRFFFYQGCTVGGSGGAYPSLGSDVIMYSNSKILGESIIGNRVILSANTYVIKRNIPDNSIVFGQGQNITVKRISDEQFIKMCGHIWNYDTGLQK